ncbi:hypothetical protein FBU30_010341 [Linnemannia zychae]|nr:hypothetical protein FBU30_010341 [Linnemannia zychae]
MSLPIEFRSVAHEFLNKGFHGAAFVGTKAADSFWFYRFDTTFIEVRDIFTCHDKVFASLSTSDIKQHFRHIFKGDQLKIVNVQDAYVGESYTIVLVVREGDEDRDHVFIWNLLTLQLQWLVSPLRLLTAVTVTPQQAIMKDQHHQGPASRTSIDLDEEQEYDTEVVQSSQSKWRTQNNRRQLLVLGHRNGWITIYKFSVSATGQANCNKEPEHEKWLEDGSITCLATLSNKNTAARPVIVVGTSEGKVVVTRYDDAKEGNKLESLITIKELHSKTLPITSLTLEPTKEDSLDLLVVGQGSWPGLTKSRELPAVSIYYLRLQKSDSRFLGHILPPTVEGEISTGGSTLVTAVSEDSLGRRVHCVFSTDFENATSLSHLVTVQINHTEVPESTVISIDDVGGGSLLDISPQTNSRDLMILYLSKLISPVKATDMDGSILESDWRNDTVGKEPIYRDMAPLYHAFFQEREKFTYSDSELDEIERRRQELGGKLFIDRLLEFVGLKGNIMSNCLAYYLLKNQHGDINEYFLREYRIPPKFVDLINGFWALDHFDFKAAVLYLSRPGLVVDWIEEVIEAIAQHGSPHLARQFLVAADLHYTSEKFIETKMKILIETDFTDAFYYQRSSIVTDQQLSTPQHNVLALTERKKRLFTYLMDYCFLDKPNRKGIQMLSHLTMNEVEEQMFIQYCDDHSGLTREVGQEFLIMYYANRSRYMEAIQMHKKRLAVEQEKDDEEQLRHGSLQQSALSRPQKRRVLIDQLTKILPAPQRMILELEKEKQQQGQTKTSHTQMPMSSRLSFNTDRKGQNQDMKAELAVGAKGILQALLDETDTPSISLKGLDLDWATRSLTGSSNDVEVDSVVQESIDAMSMSNDEHIVPDEETIEKVKTSAIEIMDLDSDDN